MSKEEYMNCLFGEFMDLYHCYLIQQGSAKQKPPVKKLGFWEALALR